MKCFFPFKDRSKTRQAKSAPELNNQGSTSDPRTTKSTGEASSSRSIPEVYKEKGQNLRAFSYSELKDATNDFNRMQKIGEGGFGSVYKGTIKDQQGNATVVAIKKLNPHGWQGQKQWLAEVQFLGVVSHPNLVKLLGYCQVEGERSIQLLLVYEYMVNKSLEDHLFKRTLEALPWKTRLEIILGAAEGLAYLHEGMEGQIIFRDFKTSNVLLDADFKPKLSDFGLAREGPTGDRTHVSTAAVGTYGYAAPEYVDTGHLTKKSDVYSFGVVLYEILTGRQVVERNRPTKEQKLLEWVKQYPAETRKFVMIMDPRMKNQYSLNAARKIAKLADSCLKKNQKERPTMSQVVAVLKQAMVESEAEISSQNTSSSEPSSSRPVSSSKPSHQMGLPHPRGTSVKV